MTESIKQIHEEAASKLAAIQTFEDLESFRLAYLSKKGKLSGLFQKIVEIPVEDKKKFGSEVNELKSFLEEAYEQKKKAIAGLQSEEKKFFDDSLPSIYPRVGRVHPISQTIKEITRIFERFGFQVVDGPEIETEFHNFTALNIPLDHVSRDAFDTFYTSSGHLLRSQTSTVQIRVMQNTKPPLRVIAPGRVYRPDTVDASHSFMFHQIEGLMVDDKATFSDLKGVIHLFLRELFGSDIKIRFRPHFFPFTEPSVEVDLKWGDRGWLEILGAGSVDPNVFKAVGYDPKKIQGFAFGLGVERIAMLRHNIKDIRLFYENNLRFLDQF